MLGSLGTIGMDWERDRMGVGGPGGGWPRGPAPGSRPVCLLPLRPPPPLLCCFLIQASGLGFPQESRYGLAQGGHSRATSTPLTQIHLPSEKGTRSLLQPSGHRHLTRNRLPGLPTAPLLRLKRQQPQPLLLKKDPHGHPYLSSFLTPQPVLPQVAQTNQLLLAPPAAPPAH